MMDSTPDKIPTLETIQQQFEQWRNHRAKNRERIPTHLWQAAAQLCQTHSISHVCRQLRLSFTELKKRVSSATRSQSRFMEIDLGSLAGGWRLECDHPNGAKLRLSGSGQVPAVEMLLRQFLS
jgi:hypothetical protein